MMEEQGPGSVGGMVRQRRKAMDLTLAELAELSGLTKSYLSMIENKRIVNPPSRFAVEALEKALGIEGGALRRAAQWEGTPAIVREKVQLLTEEANRARELAGWIKKAASRRKDGGKNLDEVYRSGELMRRVNAMLGAAAEETAVELPTGAEAPVAGGLRGVRYRVPLINRVAAGYPKGFTDLDYPARVADEYVPAPEIADPHAFAARVIGESMQPQYQPDDIVIFSPAAEVTSGCDCFVRLLPDHETTFKRVFLDPDAQGGGHRIRLQPLNPAFAAGVYEREQVAGMYKAVWRLQRL